MERIINLAKDLGKALLIGLIGAAVYAVFTLVGWFFICRFSL